MVPFTLGTQAFTESKGRVTLSRNSFMLKTRTSIDVFHRYLHKNVMHGRAVHRNGHYHTDGQDKYVIHENQISISKLPCHEVLSMNAFSKNDKNKV